MFDKTFSAKSKIIAQMKSVHEGKKTIKCKMCKKG